MKIPTWLVILLALACFSVGGLAAHHYWPQQPIIINLPFGVKAKDFNPHISLEPANYSAIISTIPPILFIVCRRQFQSHWRKGSHYTAWNTA